MKLENINQVFSKMEWLDEEILRNSKSEGRNTKSDFYYKNLSIIKEKQEKGVIPFDEYKKVGGYDSIEYGFYIANIHYDLFIYDKTKKNDLEDRIIFFLQNANEELFKYETSWFRLNFYIEYSHYLRQIYKTEDDLEHFVYELNNEREKAIYDILWKKYLKGEYIKEKINLDYCSEEVNDYFLNAEIIDADDFEDNQDFIRYCKKVIEGRVNIIKKYSVLDFNECKSYHLNDINKLKGILIYCGKDDYDTQDVIYCNLEDICKCKNWEVKFGIRLITDY